MGRLFLTPVVLGQQPTPSAPGSGQVALYAKSDDRVYTRTSGGAERLVTPGIVFALSYTGTLTTLLGAHRVYNDTGAALTIRSVRASVGTAPTGAAVICDVRVDNTTIFPGGTNQPQVAAGANTDKTTGMSTTTIADGSYFTVDVVQVGSTVPGADLTVQILCG